jgi:hypothetical protein
MSSVFSRHHSAVLSRRCRPGRRRAAAVGLSAAVLTLLAGCSSGGESPGGSGSASTQLSPRQELLAAAAQTRQVTSATETLTVHHSGASTSTTTELIRFRLKPTLLAGGDIDTRAGGTHTRVKMIITGSDIYFHESSLASQVGKPWVKISLSALSTLGGTAGAGLVQMVHGLESNNFTNQAQLFTVAKNVRVVGKQTVDGVSTTEYAGSFTAAEGLKALPVSFRQALAPGLQALGNSTIYFREWIDGQHHPRKVTEIGTLNGDTINTTINITAINQPVDVTLPPASQTFTLQGSGPVSRTSGNGGLGAKVVPAPSGFALSQATDVHNGPVSAAKFNQIMGGGNPAASLHFVRGYDVTYDSTTTSTSIEVFLFQFATSADAAVFKEGSLSVAPGKPKADPFITGAEDYDATSPSQGMYDHGVIAIKGHFVFVIDEATGSAAPAPLVEKMARQQYAAL